MGLRVALGYSLTRSAVAVAFVAALAGACAILFATRTRSRSALAFGQRRPPRRAVRPSRGNDEAPARAASARRKTTGS